MPLLNLIKRADHSVEIEQRIYALLHKKSTEQKISTKIIHNQNESSNFKVYFKFSLENISEIMLGPQLKNELSLLKGKCTGKHIF